MTEIDISQLNVRICQLEDKIRAIREDMANIASIIGVSLAGRQKGRPELQALLAEVFERNYSEAQEITPAGGAGVNGDATQPQYPLE